MLLLCFVERQHVIANEHGVWADSRSALQLMSAGTLLLRESK